MGTNLSGSARVDAPRTRPAVVAVLRPTAVALAIAGAVLLAVPAVLHSGGTEPGRLDSWVQRHVDTPSAGWPGVLVVDWIGEPIGRLLTVLLVTALCLLARRPRLALATVTAVVAVTVLSTILKHVVDRRIHGDFLSYPSGHTAAATAICLLLGLLLSDLLKLGRVVATALVLGLALAGGAVTAYAQIDLTAHYPTDTLGGFGCALLVVPAAALLIDRFADRR
ncbi:phosphatase PAP2 family protein [Kribbella endophytica]